MERYFNKDLMLSSLAVVLVFCQSKDSSILIEVALIFITLELARTKKKDGSKFDFYIWAVLFIAFVLQFILKAFILN
jgi:hypothetical protein